MKTRIYKYPLEVTDKQWLDLPENAQILTVQIQGDTPCLWARVDPDARCQRRLVRTIGTGHLIEDGFDMTYLGTYQFPPLVFHVFIK